MPTDAKTMTIEDMARELGLDSANVARRLSFVGFTHQDAQRVLSVRPLVEANVESLTSAFINFLAELPEAQTLLSRPDLVKRVRELKADHLIAMVSGNYGPDYAKHRLELALLYAKVGLDTRVFLGAFHSLLKNLGELIIRNFEAGPLEGFKAFMAVKKVAFFDIGLIIDTLVLTRERTIRDQQAELAKSLDQLRHAQKMEAVGRLAGGIAHDFNNMVTIIRGYSEEALSKMATGDPGRELIEPILEAAQRSAMLTRQLLAFSRKQVMMPQALNLNEAVESMGRMLERVLGEDISIVVKPSQKLDAVLIDPGQLEQIIMNLAINARDAMPTGGTLIIETSNVVLDEDYARSHNEAVAGPHVMIAVSDTGTGIDAETKAKIFEPFFTTKAAGTGTGLGLSTVYGIVKQSGGNIWVYSEVGVGTTFKVFLPRHLGKTARQAAQAAAETTMGRETVLLVEDEEILRKLFRLILTTHGYTVLDTGDPLQALKLFQSHRDDIDLLLTDMVMPKMSGRLMAEKILEMRPGLKVAYMSGYTDDAIVQNGLLGPGCTFIGKPVGREELLKKIREFLDAP